jgi:hypothetical protein
MSYNITLNRIKEIRAENNDAWMDILQIALECDPIRTCKALSRVKENDKHITNLTQTIVDEATAPPPT